MEQSQNNYESKGSRIKNNIYKVLSKTKEVLIVSWSFVFTKAKRPFKKLNPREKFWASLFAFIIAGSLIAVGVQLYISNTKNVPAQGGEYREAVVGLPRFINPALSFINDVDRDMVRLIYSGLLAYDVNGNLIPDLAQSFEISDDGKEYIFTLKENLLWEDGIPLTAEDVIFTINLIQDAQYSSSIYQVWQGVDVSIEENNIIFQLSSAYPPFIYNTTLPIMPKHIWENVLPINFALTDLNLQPIGSGPYKIEKFTKDNSGLISSATLERNEFYHGPKPYISRITFKFFNSSQDAIKAYNSKSVDGISFISPLNIEEIKDRNGVNFHKFNMPGYFAIFINENRNPILEEKSVREALAHATNRDQIISDAYLGHAEKIDSPIPKVLSKYYNNDIDPIPYDLGKARALLEDAGWKDDNGDGIREKALNDGEDATNLELTLYTAENGGLKKSAELLAAQWKNAGVQLNVVTMETTELQQSIIRSRSYELLLFGQIVGMEPDLFPYWYSTQTSSPGLNLSEYENSDADDLIEEIRAETNEAQRIEKLKELQKLIVSELPAIFLFSSAHIYPVQKGVQGIMDGVITDTPWRFAEISKWFIETKRIFD
ncbi:MAG: hypothetical protein A2919_01500 [Candidatus Spechtbacteria bacterium RIFCSPLOWO2_01_FULL_43_12]|uniref:Solute-binding protein family 5 domain-containing protein n=1 Tax=Candidatus Spechtbacteria bacterium RIFCSPLOWO2_01_FULL_43_12 TaxID=1802162 RepID=A0A1G2HFE4_9BACT|nr:MAG: hypothetical protein A2919_01500 [Candidatus Spechtbacteria bacterium RIFCSPLOWO2_01_FULL_43_12]